MSLETLFYSSFQETASYDESVSAFDRTPPPPERKDPYTFKLVRQGSVYSIFKFSVTKDGQEQVRQIRAQNVESFHSELKKLFGEDVDVEAKATELLNDANTRRGLGISLIASCDAPGERYDGFVFYPEFTSFPRGNNPTSPLAYLAAKLGCQVSKETPWTDIAAYLNSTLPDEDTTSASQSEVKLAMRTRWFGHYFDSKQKYQAIRGMARWPKKLDEKGKPLTEHETVLELPGASEPINAGLEVLDF